MNIQSAIRIMSLKMSTRKRKSLQSPPWQETIWLSRLREIVKEWNQSPYKIWRLNTTKGACRRAESLSQNPNKNPTLKEEIRSTNHQNHL